MEANAHKRDNHTPSCAVCQRRKVKCNRRFPCNACTKSGLECTFPPPSRPGKRARRNSLHPLPGPERTSSTQHPPHDTRDPAAPPADRPSSGSLTSSKHGHGHDFSSPDSAHSAALTGARLVSDGSGLRYVNNHLWSAISADAHRGHRSPPRPTSAGSRSGDKICDEDGVRSGGEVSGGRSFVFGGPAAPTRLNEFPPNHIVYLWQTYLANIDPVMKISHAPTIQLMLLGQIGRPNVLRNEQALTSAIYFISAVSLTDEQSLEHLQDSRVGLIRKYRDATEASLSAVGFITTTDTMVLQALILYLAALRSLGEFQTVWSLFGLAIRIAGTIGLTRDGTSFGLSPFETEMRRRLWWSIVYFDGRMAELVGQDGDLMGNDYEAAPPSNLNDSDLFPTMSRLPESRRGPTESVYLQARVLSVTMARQLQGMSGPQGTWHKLQDASMSTSEKLEIMQTIEQRYNEEILEPCDPSVPLQWLSINTARVFATKLRLIARIPVVDLDREWESADGFSENAFLLSMDLLQLQVDLWCEPGVQQWRWHWQAHFQWYSLVTLLRQTRLRRSGHGILRAWTLIRKAFSDIIPTLELGPRKSLLLDGIHGLLSAAKRQQENPNLDDNGRDRTPRPESNSTLSPPDSTPVNAPNRFGAGYGSQPHSALLPGMDMTTQMPTPTSFGRDAFDDQGDLALGFDLEAMDWAEFDRLASELCQQ